MNSPSDHDHEMSAAEALVRSAGRYVRPSENLRPRVLEAARSQRDDRRTQRRVWQVALLVVLLGGLTTLARVGTGIDPSRQFRSFVEMDPHVGSPGAVGVPGAGFGAEAAMPRDDSGWGTVEFFQKLRRQHAELLRLAM